MSGLVCWLAVLLITASPAREPTAETYQTIDNQSFKAGLKRQVQSRLKEQNDELCLFSSQIQKFGPLTPLSSKNDVVSENRHS